MRAYDILKSMRVNKAVFLLIFFVMGGLRISVPSLFAESAVSTEYQVKAACLLNFVHFIQWPESAFSMSGQHANIGVLGEDSYGDILEQMFRGERVQGRNVGVKKSRQMEDLKDCLLIFVSRSEKNNQNEKLKAMEGAPIVSVGEMEGFIRSGGVINFYIENNKIRFEINAAEARRKGLKIHSQLLKRAHVVNAVPEKEGG